MVPGSAIPFSREKDQDRATLDVLGIVLDEAKRPLGRIRRRRICPRNVMALQPNSGAEPVREIDRTINRNAPTGCRSLNNDINERYSDGSRGRPTG